MNREDIIRMAREAGAVFPADGSYHRFESEENLERFAALVASAERERLTDAAMKAAEKAVDVAIALEREACIEDIQWHIPRSGRHTPEYQMAMRMIERIRARGQA